MKIVYGSDIHLNAGARNFDLPDGDLLILAGDVLDCFDLKSGFKDTKVGKASREFLEDVSSKYKHIIWVPGNHEYYMSDISTLSQEVNGHLHSEGLNNIIFNPAGQVTIGGIHFIYATLWTDCNKGDEMVMYRGYRYMNDFAYIGNRDKSFSPTDMVQLHDSQRKFISDTLSNTRTIVITHHAPVLFSAYFTRCNEQRYMYHCTDMEDIILDNPQIEAWIWGHTHIPADTMIGNTRMLSNPRGRHVTEFELKVLEI